MTNTGVALGDLVRHTITNFQGIVVARTAWLNGCVRCVVQSRDLKDGKPIDCQTFDVEELEILHAAAVVSVRHPDRQAVAPPPSGPKADAAANRRG